MFKPIEVIVADDNVNLCQQLEEFYSARSDIKIVAIANDGETALKLVETYKPDLLLLDIIMPRLDGISVLYELQKRKIDLKKLVITAFGQARIMSKAAQLGADYYLVKPFNFSVLTDRIKDVCGIEEKIYYKKKFDFDVASLVTETLDNLGIPANLKGYDYITTAVFLVLNDWNLLHSVTSLLYPEVARTHGATGAQVERAIRHAIEYAWLNGDVVTLESHFGTIDPEMGRPSNANFIGRLAEIIKNYM